MKAVISISGTQGIVGDDSSTIELITDGIYTAIPDGYAVKYKESELTGLEGTTTTVEVTSAGVSVERRGWLNSRMDFSEGQKTSFLYDTQFGSATLGVDTRKITSEFNERGGKLCIDYIVNMEHLVAMKNRLTVTIRKQGAQQQ